MKKPNFTSPHVHIQSLDSGSTPTAFVKRELELGTGALVVTDHGTLGACHSVYELAKKNKLIPVLGLEGYFRDDNCPILTAAGVAKTYPKKQRSKDVDTSKPLGFSGYSKYHHITLGFRDYAAFQVGIKLLSRAPAEQHGEIKPLFNWENLEELGASNTTMTTGCLIGMVQRHLLDHNDPVMARRYYERLRAIVKPGNFYVEVFPHDCSHNWVEGVFLKVKDVDGNESTRRFYAGKTLKTDVCELKALDLAMAWAKPSTNKHTRLIAIKNRSTWEDFEPVEIVEVRHDPGSFIRNECGPYAPDGDVQLGGNRFMLELAREYGDPVLVSDDAHYAHPDEKIVQDVRLAQSGSWRFYGSYHRQSSDEAFAYFSSRMGIEDKEFDGWVENSHNWAQGFKDFKFETKLSIPTKFYEVQYAASGCKNSLEYTLKLVRDHGRMDWKDPVRVARLEREINLLYRNGVVDWLPYFMIAEEVCRLYRDNGKLTGPGRGSAAGLYLSYLLSITHVDPIRYKLSVDRFLTLDRIMSGKPPDIDQDLTDRDLLVGEDGTGGWLQQRFGDHVAQISTIMTLKLKSAVLDVARFTLGAVPREIAQLAHSFEVPPQGLEDYKFVFGYEDSGNWVDGSITYDAALKKYSEKYPEQWDVVQKCLGLGRGVSRHACGFLIANRPIWEFIPLTTIGGITCTQFTAGAVEAVGGLKMDFLVINSLNDLSNAINLIQQRVLGVPDGMTIDGKWVPKLRLVPFGDSWADIWDLPSDQAVFADIATGKTETVFQFNTPGAKQWLRQFGHKKPNGNYAIDSVEEMAAFTALDRPGPLDAKVSTPGFTPSGFEVGTSTSRLNDPDEKFPINMVSPRPTRDEKNGGKQEEKKGQHNMLVEYARRARGLEPSPDIFPIFNKLFPETHGIMIFQEQLQRMYQEITGCTGPQAEEFRSNVAKKKKEKIVAAYPGFISAAAAKLGSKEDAEAVWSFIQSWAAYGFNKSMTGDTILQTCEGKEKFLSDFVPGDLVFGVDDAGGLVRNEVVALHDHGTLPGFEVEFDDGHKVIVSGNHKFLTKAGQKPLWEIVERELGVFCAERDSKVWGANSTSEQQRAPGSLCGVSGKEVAKHSSEDAYTQSLRDTASCGFYDGEKDLRTPRNSTPEGGQNSCVAASQPGENPGNLGERSSSCEEVKNGGVVAFQQHVDVARGEGSLWRGAQASGLRLGDNLGGGRRLLPLLRGVENQTKTNDGSDPGRDVERRSSSARECDVDSFVRRMLQDLGRQDERRVAPVAYSDAPLANTRGLVLRKIVRVRSVGLRRMYDLEVSHPKHNFLLPNGVITSNSHSVCYSVIAYACAYLKHRFPLEWWTAVLRNATKEEINEDFWPHCGKYIKLPDVTKAYENFEIVDDKIQAPLSLLHGVGPTAHTELVQCAPYTDIADFVKKREDWKAAHSKKEVVKSEVEAGIIATTEKVVKGRSALGNGLVYRLIVSGAMDGLFPGKTTLQALEAFEQAVWDQEQIGKKRPSKKLPKVKPEYVDIDPLVRYQMRKQILPAYSENLLKTLVESRHPQFFYKEGFRFRYCDSDESVRITNPSEWLAMQNQSPADGKSFIRAIVGYVESARIFEHGPKDPVTGVRHSPKPALELVIDMGNERAKVVKWPARDANKLDPKFLQPLQGALVVAVVTKYSSSKGFSVQDLEVIEKPLGDEKDE